jgi:CheY-like chemotaxis protein/HPt (histidine-containing phosphotransfer) domain-containing protein
VLVAEDNLINQEVAVALLEQAGLQVDVASNGAEALDLVASHSYSLVLMDMQMPVLDGLQATRAIRVSEGAARGSSGGGLPIIAMTANAFGEDRNACLAAGMNDHVAKPVDTELLYTTLLRWLDREQMKLSDSSSRPGVTDQAANAQSTSQRGVAPDDADTGAAGRSLDAAVSGHAASAKSDLAGQHLPDAVGTAAPAGTPIIPAPLPPAPDAAGPRLVEQRLAEVCGLSPARGLRLVGGRMGTYLRVALQFADLYRAGVPGLMTALRGADGAAAREAVHSFKGASATLGAEALAERAGQLEQAMVAGLPQEVLIAVADDLDRELVVLVAGLDQALGTGQPPGSGQQLT